MTGSGWWWLGLGGVRAGQYVGIYHTDAISLKYRDVLSQNHNKTEYRIIMILQYNRNYHHTILRENHVKLIKYCKKFP